MREVVRLLLPLPSYVPLPNGHQTFVPFPPTDGSRSQRETFALVTLRHVHESRHLLSENSFREAIKVAQEAGLMDRPGDVVENSEEQIDHWTTVADVITPRLSGDESAVLDSVAPEDRRPREDALMRALEATQQVVRACILTHQVPVVLPTYERLPTLLLGWSGIAPLHDPQWAPAAALTWDEPYVMHLNHNDITGWEQAERAELESVARQVSIWQDRIEAGSPSLRVREPFILAQHELHVNGGYGQSILASSIGVEVLCYLVAVSLLWEEHRNDPTCPGEVEVAEHLASKDYAWVAESVIRTRLGGNWNRDGKSSYWGAWRRNSARVRNKILHSGHRARRHESVQAITESLDFQKFVFNRIHARIGKYPFTALMLLGEDGIARRGEIKGSALVALEGARVDDSDWHLDFISFNAHVTEGFYS